MARKANPAARLLITPPPQPPPAGPSLPPRWNETLTDNRAIVGGLLALQALAFAASSVPVGFFLDRLGCRRSLVIGLVLEARHSGREGGRSPESEPGLARLSLRLTGQPACFVVFCLPLETRRVRAPPRSLFSDPPTQPQGMFFYMLTLGRQPGRGAILSGDGDSQRFVLPAVSQVVGGVALAFTMTPLMPMLESAVRPLGEGAVVMARGPRFLARGPGWAFRESPVLSAKCVTTHFAFGGSVPGEGVPAAKQQCVDHLRAPHQ